MLAVDIEKKVHEKLPKGVLVFLDYSCHHSSSFIPNAFRYMWIDEREFEKAKSFLTDNNVKFRNVITKNPYEK